MTTKTQTHDLARNFDASPAETSPSRDHNGGRTSKNGDVPVGQREVTRVRLSPSQQKHLTRLVMQIDVAERELKVATETRDKAQGTANEFLMYCAEEMDVQLDEGWKFDQGQMSFVRTAEES